MVYTCQCMTFQHKWLVTTLASIITGKCLCFRPPMKCIHVSARCCTSTRPVQHCSPAENECITEVLQRSECQAMHDQLK